MGCVEVGLIEGSFSMTNHLDGAQRHLFGVADHGQRPQSGDTQLTSGGSLRFLMGVTIPSGRELVFLSGHTPPVICPQEF